MSNSRVSKRLIANALPAVKAKKYSQTSSKKHTAAMVAVKKSISPSVPLKLASDALSQRYFYDNFLYPDFRFRFRGRESGCRGNKN